MVQFIILRGTATIWQIDTIYLAGNVTYCTLITFVKSWFIFVIVIFLGFGSPELRLRAVSVGSSKVREKCTDMIFRGKLFDPQAIQARRT